MPGSQEQWERERLTRSAFFPWSLPTCVTIDRFRLACGPHLACCLFRCITFDQQRPSSFFYVSSLVFSQDKGRVEDLEQGLSGR